MYTYMYIHLCNIMLSSLPIIYKPCLNYFCQLKVRLKFGSCLVFDHNRLHCKSVTDLDVTYFPLNI